MEKILVKGDTYTVASKTTCTVTSAAGANLGTAFPGAPLRFTATTDLITLSDDAAEIARVADAACACPAPAPQGNPLVCSWEDVGLTSNIKLSAFHIYVEVPGVLESLCFYVSDNQRVLAEYCVDVILARTRELLRAKVPLLFESESRGYKCTIRFAQPIPVSMGEALQFEFYIKSPRYGFDDYTSLREVLPLFTLQAIKGSGSVARSGWGLIERTDDENQFLSDARLMFMSLAYRTPLPGYWGFLLMPQEGTISGNSVNMPDGSGYFTISSMEEGKYFYFNASTQPLPLELMYKNITELYPDLRVVILPAAVSLDGYGEM